MAIYITSTDMPYEDEKMEKIIIFFLNFSFRQIGTHYRGRLNGAIKRNNWITFCIVWNKSVRKLTTTTWRQKINWSQPEYTILQLQVRSSIEFLLFLLHFCYFRTFKCNYSMWIFGTVVDILHMFGWFAISSQS